MGGGGVGCRTDASCILLYCTRNMFVANINRWQSEHKEKRRGKRRRSEGRRGGGELGKGERGVGKKGRGKEQK